jgi:predicted RNA binding protein YcfA (HicA-like mRNA interferase family)
MPHVVPIKRESLIKYLRSLGFEGPLPGTKHQIMKKDSIRFRLPNPHHNDISANLLSRLLKEAGISRETWEKL